MQDYLSQMTNRRMHRHSKESLAEWIAGLTPVQRDAVQHLDGPLLVISGAGSGKTRVMTLRAAWACAIRHVQADHCLTVTFTVRAAREVRERLETLLGASLARQFWVNTFNAYCLTQLRDYPEALGLRNEFRIAEASDSDRLLRQELIAHIPEIKSLKLDEDFLTWRKARRTEPGERDPGEAARGEAAREEDPEKPAEDQPDDDQPEEGQGSLVPTRDALKAMRSAISRFKANLVVHDAAERWVSEQAAGGRLGSRRDAAILQLATLVYPGYQAGLRDENMADFDDMILGPVLAMQKSETRRRRWANRLTMIQVDEFQDTNPAQFAWLQLMCRGHGNVCAVGDDDQTIFRFNSADPIFALEFDRFFPGARRVVMADNFRNGAHILACANALIGKNLVRFEKKLVANRPEGEKPCIAGLQSDWEEADYVAASILDYRRTRPEADFFILYRANYESRRFEESLIRSGISYSIVGDVGYYNRLEVLDALAYFSLAELCEAPAEESYPHFLRVLERPARGIAEGSAKAMLAAARQAGARTPLFSAEALAPLKGKRREALEPLLSALAAYQIMEAPPEHRARRLLDVSGYFPFWLDSDESTAPDRVRNLEELLGALSQCASMGQFLDRAAEAQNKEDPQAPVRLMSMHRSKGLEADMVLLVGWEDGGFPAKPAIDALERDDTPMEDERRLAYVALTRGRDRVILTYPQSRFGAPRIPSRFLDELPEAHRDWKTFTRERGRWLESQPGNEPTEDAPSGKRQDKAGSAMPAKEPSQEKPSTGKAMNQPVRL